MGPHGVNIEFDRVHEFYDLYVNTKLDIGFWLAVARQSLAPRLELMCGTGRITLPLLEAGFEIEGLDYSGRLLDVFRKKLTERGLTTHLYHGDARHFKSEQRYGLIFIGFQAIAEVLDDADKLQLFDTIHRHLLPQGQFWLTIHNPEIRRQTLDGRKLDLGTFPLATPGEEVRISATFRLNHENGLVSGVQTYRCFRGDKPTRAIDLPVRFHLLEPERLEELIRSAGMTVTRRLGDYEGGLFDADRSPFFIVCCRPE